MENPNSTPNGAVPAGRVQDEECSNCGTKKAWVLHNVRYRANLRRLCTSCVLRLHPSSFCPLCFLSHPDLNSQNALVSCSKCPSLSHPDLNSQNALVSCSKCPSLSHPDCLPPYAAFSPSPFLCPPCSSANPNTFSFFQLDDRHRSLDKRLAAVLLCAATIAASSMSKAVAVARAEAERRVREAANARKRAREALDRFVILSSSAKAVRADVSGSSNGGKQASKNNEKPNGLKGKE
ncbi:hypothetical protein ACLB2K_057112 [Fragaria x ananassa]